MPASSDEIMAELMRTLEEKIGLAPTKAAYLEREIHRSFPGALVVGYEALTPKMASYPKDRQVQTAARAINEIDGLALRDSSRSTTSRPSLLVN